ncbi:hypothetical protein PROFUN_08088 [Planoprotostelium fungivorum]|uniref:Uncharacterized protein n=1 Tax=Planoprotostelium fungivorum TaxID=1890364 RepID=A0A2P6NKD2_9EUKA|nr:hypothetical protein PROFUN_08088 [Planoprotostelium fungivorum]
MRRHELVHFLPNFCLSVIGLNEPASPRCLKDRGTLNLKTRRVIDSVGAFLRATEPTESRRFRIGSGHPIDSMWRKTLLIAVCVYIAFASPSTSCRLRECNGGNINNYHRLLSRDGEVYRRIHIFPDLYIISHVVSSTLKAKTIHVQSSYLVLSSNASLLLPSMTVQDSTIDFTSYRGHFNVTNSFSLSNSTLHTNESILVSFKRVNITDITLHGQWTFDCYRSTSCYLQQATADSLTLMGLWRELDHISSENFTSSGTIFLSERPSSWNVSILNVKDVIYQHGGRIDLPSHANITLQRLILYNISSNYTGDFVALSGGTIRDQVDVIMPQCSCGGFTSQWEGPDLHVRYAPKPPRFSYLYADEEDTPLTLVLDDYPCQICIPPSNFTLQLVDGEYSGKIIPFNLNSKTVTVGLTIDDLCEVRNVSILFTIQWLTGGSYSSVRHVNLLPRDLALGNTFPWLRFDDPHNWMGFNDSLGNVTYMWNSQYFHNRSVCSSQPTGFIFQYGRSYDGGVSVGISEGRFEFPSPKPTSCYSPVTPANVAVSYVKGDVAFHTPFVSPTKGLLPVRVHTPHESLNFKEGTSVFSPNTNFSVDYSPVSCDCSLGNSSQLKTSLALYMIDKDTNQVLSFRLDNYDRASIPYGNYRVWATGICYYSRLDIAVGSTIRMKDVSLESPPDRTWVIAVAVLVPIVVLGVVAYLVSRLWRSRRRKTKTYHNTLDEGERNF